MNCPGCGQPITQLTRTAVQTCAVWGEGFLYAPETISQVFEHSCGFKDFGVTKDWYMDEQHTKLVVKKVPVG